MYCKECGKEIKEKAVICTYCGCAAHHGKSRGVTFLLWFLLGGLGAHRFYLNQTWQGWAIIVGGFLSLCTCFLVFPIFPILIWGLVVFFDIIVVLCNDENFG